MRQLFAALIAIGILAAQDSATRIDATTANRVALGAIEKLNSAYVFPDVAKKMESDVRERIARKEYDQIATVTQLCDKLTADLQSVSHDKHIRLAPAGGPPRAAGMAPSANRVVEKAEILAGNVGYMDFRQFAPPSVAGGAVADALNTLGATDALIIDLRRNGGGAPAMVALLASYLMGPTPVQLNSLYTRGAQKPTELWTLAEVSGKRYGPDKPVFVLTSKRTFSAAEGFTYHLKALRRITVVGEVSGGGANPGGFMPIDDRFVVFVPTGHVVNPITKTNWEGVGIRPDIAVDVEKALPAAHRMALQKLLDKASSATAKTSLQKAIAALDSTGQ